MGSLHNQWSDCQKQYQYQLHYLQCKNNCMVWDETWGLPPLVSLWNDVREMCAEVPYWWHITTLIWVVLQFGRTTREICFNQSKHYPDLRSDTSSVRISALVPQTSYRGETGGVATKCWLFSQAECGWVLLALLCHLVLPSDYKNYMMFSKSPSGVSVNNGHGATLWEYYQIYNRNNATLTAFTWTFLYYHQKKKTALYTAGCKINTITCQMQVTNHLKAWQDTCLMTKAVKCTLICLQKKRKKLYSRLELFTDLQHLQ